MGYVRVKKIYKLVFEDPEMDGLVVRAKSVPVGQFVELARLAELDKKDTYSGEDLEQIDRLFRGFASALVSWNLEDDNEDGATVPVPASVDGLYAQDLEFVMAIIAAWMQAMGGVTGPKEQRSNAGELSLAASIPMEPLSPSLVS